MDAGRELAALVAEKVMGYATKKVKPEWYPVEVTLFYHPEYPDYLLYSYDERSCNAMMFRNGVDDKGGTAPPLPNYSDDIAAAWEVVERLEAKEWHAMVERRSPGGGWMAYFQPWDMDTPDVGIAATAPHAICLAALKAVGALPATHQQATAPSDPAHRSSP